jgi:hypothetical protein
MQISRPVGPPLADGAALATVPSFLPSSFLLSSFSSLVFLLAASSASASSALRLETTGLVPCELMEWIESQERGRYSRKEGELLAHE